jgi:hypothetical protein
MTPEQQIAYHIEYIFKICDENGLGDPTAGGRLREIHMAGILGHKISPTLTGADAIDHDGECEYKSTNDSNIKASYGGISVFPTWEEQMQYLINDKICKYKNHYYSRYENGQIVEVWKLNCNDVLKLLEQKLYRKWKKITEGKVQLKDPRLSAQIGKTEIMKYGEKIYEYS